ncbi:MAG TPA: hypothetical protein VH619_15035 [Verrucomicrobiae bacterium]|jgi:DNA topoisomerase IB|nr:hypothetical protein [Verrucomicrobiae bacterium]
MRLRHYLAITLASVFLISLGGVSAYTYLGKRIGQLIAFEQKADLEDWEQMALQAYMSQSSDTASWVLKQYLDKVDSVYSVRPTKDREYFYKVYVGHARLAKLYRQRGEFDREASEIKLAEEASTGWSNEKKTNEIMIFESLAKIDSAEPKSR